jgi:DNA-binding CsgD family transcriptional regulator
LVTQYKITPAEARLVAKLAALRTVEEAADDLGISMATARTQLKSVFGKSGTRSQSELLLLLASGTLAQLNEG